jgi:hypothetical protein
VPAAFPSTPAESAPRSSIETTPTVSQWAAPVAAEPQVSPPPPAIVSAAKLADDTASRPADKLPPRAVPAPRSAPARQSPVLSTAARAEAQDRLRAVVNQWLRASVRGGGSAHATEPVIVVAPDGRTAKTYVSMTSPIGLIPREQRWELGAQGWTLIDDRQAGLPVPPAARTSRDR